MSQRPIGRRAGSPSVEQWKAVDEDAIIADHNSSIALSPEKPGSAGLTDATSPPAADGSRSYEAPAVPGVGGEADGDAGTYQSKLTLRQRLRHLVSEWWHHRQMAKNKEWGMGVAAGQMDVFLTKSDGAKWVSQAVHGHERLTALDISNCYGDAARGIGQGGDADDASAAPQPESGGAAAAPNTW